MIRAAASSAGFWRVWLAACLLWLAALGPANADVAVPPLTGPVVDLTGTLTPDEVAALDQRLRSFAQERGSQVQVLLLPTTAPEDIAQFGIRVADAWKIGRKAQDGRALDDGVILIIAKDDRRMRLEVGYGLEGAIPDAIAARLLDTYLQPALRAGDFAGGIGATVDAVMARITGEALPAPEAPEPGGGEPSLLFAIFIGFFVGSIAGPIFRAVIGRPAGATLAGLGAGGLAGFLLTSLAAGALGGLAGFFVALMAGLGGGKRRGGWYHGPVGGGWGGGGFGGGRSGGGWSGGGGGFGGGGASGSW